jgi:arsenate reductase
MDVTIFHNPRCSKSRETLAIIKEAGIEPLVVEYLKAPLSVNAVEELLKHLSSSAIDIVRTNESAFKELGLNKAVSSEKELIEAIATHPVLMNRPIVWTDKGAKLCRPPQLVRCLLP